MKKKRKNPDETLHFCRLPRRRRLVAPPFPIYHGLPRRRLPRAPPLQTLRLDQTTIRTTQARARSRAPSPTPAPAPKAAAGKAQSKPNAGRKPKKPFRKFARTIFQERDPDKLVSEFIGASAVSRWVRDRHRLYEVAVARLTFLGRQDAVATFLDSQKRFLEASNEGFASRLLRLYGRASMPSHAATTFLELPPKHQSVSTFNALLAAYVDAGDVDAVATALQQIPVSHPTIIPNAYSYTILIRALCQKPDLSAALDVIPLMEKCGLTPDGLCFTTLLNGFYNSGRFDDAEKVWEMMKERNVEPDTKIYNAKVRGLISKGSIDDAIALIERMQKDGPKPDTVSYNELIRGYCKEGRLDEAKKVYDDLVKNECEPNRGTFHTLVPRLVEARELDYAVSCCHEILFSSKCRVECSILQEVVTALIAASRVDEAKRIVELGMMNWYPQNVLRMPPPTGEDNDAAAATDLEDSAPDVEGHDEEAESKSA